MSLSASHVTETEQAVRPPQFGLRALLLAMTAISVVLAVFVAIGPMWSALLAMSLTLIGLHVAGNAIGTRLSEAAPRRVVGEAVQALDEPPPASHAAATDPPSSQPQ